MISTHHQAPERRMSMSALLLAANDILQISTGSIDTYAETTRQTCVADFVSSWQWVLGLTDSSYSFTLCCEGLGIDDEMLKDGFVNLMSNPDNARAVLVMVQHARRGLVFAGERPIVYSLPA